MEILQSFLLQLIFSVGLIVLFGAAIALIKKLIVKICGRFSRGIILSTGIIGTPVHETGHAFFCLLFGHRIRAIKLYQMDAKDGTLGYVNHAYNKRNLYHQIGNFFIGLGPVIFGSAVILLLMFFMARPAFNEILEVLKSVGAGRLSIFEGQTYITMLKTVGNVILAVFRPANLTSVLWWIFIVLSLCIALHMEVSPSDIRSGWIGFVFIALLFLAVDSVLFLIRASWLTAFTNFVVSGAIYIIGFLAVSVVMSLAVLLICAIVFGILRLAKVRV